MCTPVTGAGSRWARSRRPYPPSRWRADLGSVELDGAGSRRGRIHPVVVGPFGVRPTLGSACPRRIRLGPPLGHRSPRPGSDSRGRSGRCGPSGLPRPGGPLSWSTLSGSPDTRWTDFSLVRAGRVSSPGHGRDSVLPCPPVGGARSSHSGRTRRTGSGAPPGPRLRGRRLPSRRGHGPPPTASSQGGLTFDSQRIPRGPPQVGDGRRCGSC